MYIENNNNNNTNDTNTTTTTTTTTTSSMKCRYFIWGFDCNFTNYGFKRNELQKTLECRPSGKVCFKENTFTDNKVFS